MTMHRFFHLRSVAAAALLACSGATALVAEELRAPEGEVLLTIRGEIQRTNGDGVALFDRSMLEEIGGEIVETSTIWTEGVQVFDGVPLVRLLEAVGAEGETLRATAINDYTIEIPVSDAVEGGPVIAYAQGGEPMSVREKGPLWVVYPYDQRPEYQSEQIYARSIWQLVSIEVRP